MSDEKSSVPTREIREEVEQALEAAGWKRGAHDLNLLLKRAHEGSVIIGLCRKVNALLKVVERLR